MYSVGVLLIGSLVWDGQKDRRRWRTKRLDLTSITYVKVPICYGRISSSRGYTYTMVFSEDLIRNSRKMGQGIVIKCRKEITNGRDLREEAEHLWAAEREDREPDGSISRKWGRIGLFVKPNTCNHEDVKRYWGMKVQNDKTYCRSSWSVAERKLIDNNGLFTIPWPKPTNGEELSLDFILATATKPDFENGKCPNAAKIARAWKDNPKDACYFWNNIEWGIKTFQDKEIELYLRQS